MAGAGAANQSVREISVKSAAGQCHAGGKQARAFWFYFLAFVWGRFYFAGLPASLPHDQQTFSIKSTILISGSDASFVISKNLLIYMQAKFVLLLLG